MIEVKCRPHLASTNVHWRINMNAEVSPTPAGQYGAVVNSKRQTAKAVIRSGARLYALADQQQQQQQQQQEQQQQQQQQSTAATSAAAAAAALVAVVVQS